MLGLSLAEYVLDTLQIMRPQLAAPGIRKHIKYTPKLEHQPAKLDPAELLRLQWRWDGNGRSNPTLRSNVLGRLLLKEMSGCLGEVFLSTVNQPLIHPV